MWIMNKYSFIKCFVAVICLMMLIALLGCTQKENIDETAIDNTTDARTQIIGTEQDDTPVIGSGQPVARPSDSNNDNNLIPDNSGDIFDPNGIDFQYEGSYFMYTVRVGDTLSVIALRFKTTVADILKINNIPNPDKLDQGTVLKIPIR